MEPSHQETTTPMGGYPVPEEGEEETFKEASRLGRIERLIAWGWWQALGERPKCHELVVVYAMYR